MFLFTLIYNILNPVHKQNYSTDILTTCLIKKENFVNNMFTVYIQYTFLNYVNLNLIKLDKLLTCL